MQMIGDVFYIVLFVTMVGSSFTVLSLFAGRVLHFPTPLWFNICHIAAYFIPLPAPGLYLIPPEDHFWRQGYCIACMVWFCGMILLVLYDAAKTVFAHRAIRKYKVCRDKHINELCSRCARLVGTVKTPSVRFGTLDDPACVLGVLRPVIILNEAIAEQLSDAELLTVICHEITHVKRGHLFLGRIYDYVCILNWFNPFVWAAKKDFAAFCELDCDRNALDSLHAETTARDYANTMLRLLELSAPQAGHKGQGMGALGFLLAKRRITMIMNRPAKVRKITATVVLAVLLAAVLMFSVTASTAHFYPYPAYSKGAEYSHIG